MRTSSEILSDALTEYEQEEMRLAIIIDDAFRKAGTDFGVCKTDSEFVLKVYRKAKTFTIEFHPVLDAMSGMRRLWEEESKLKAAIVAAESGRDEDYFKFALKHLVVPRMEMGG